MITILYAALGSAVIVGLWLLYMGAALDLDDWARHTWLRIRFMGHDTTPPIRGIGSPPDLPSGRAYGAALIVVLTLFLGALGLPR